MDNFPSELGEKVIHTQIVVDPAFSGGNILNVFASFGGVQRIQTEDRHILQETVCSGIEAE